MNPEQKDIVNPQQKAPLTFVFVPGFLDDAGASARMDTNSTGSSSDQGSLVPQIDSGDLGQIDVHMQDVAIAGCGMPPGVAEHITHQPILDQNVGNETLNCVAVSDV